MKTSAKHKTNSSKSVENEKLKEITQNFDKAWEEFKKAPHAQSKEWGIESGRLLHEFGKKMYQAGNEELKSVTIDAINFTTPVYQGLRAMDVKNVFEILTFSRAQLEQQIGAKNTESLIKVLARDRGVTLFN